MKFDKSLLAAVLAILAGASAAEASPIEFDQCRGDFGGRHMERRRHRLVLHTDRLITLTAIGTKFGSSSTPTVTAEIFTGSPGELTFIPSTLTLLSSGTLTPIQEFNSSMLRSRASR